MLSILTIVLKEASFSLQRMNTPHNTITWTGRKHITVLLFTLSMLMLVGSCPFKRLLQHHIQTQASTQMPVKWNSPQQKRAAYGNTSCCSLKQKTTLAKTTITKHEVPSPHFFADMNVPSGFAIYYFLNGTDNRYNHSASLSLSSLPLFLQHRRLLI